MPTMVGLKGGFNPLPSPILGEATKDGASLNRVCRFRCVCMVIIGIVI